ncbi:BnaA02g26530D [Brassica napus]|uniref:BnaA02g26530D protein n=1 Tax=Brassica napus TaxID=3708 RepID=A0A078F8C7_BRANA|nr:BnaA02g26530D [Brassica napus]
MDLFSAPYDTNETGVFWDFDECGIPDELSAAGVLQRMRHSLLHKGHRGPVSIQIYGDLTGLDFQSSDIKLNHFHSGEKREKMTKILEDMVSWSGENPEPSVGLLALGDVGDAGDDIVEVVELLKSQKNYRFMVLTPPPLPPPPPTVQRISCVFLSAAATGKLLDLGLRGPVSIRIYGDLTGLDFQSSGDVKLHHFHAVLGHLGAADDADITEVIELLKTQKNYQFMLVTPESPPPPTVR